MPQFPKRDDSGPKTWNKSNLKLSKLPHDIGQQP